MEQIYYSPRGFWRGKSAIAKLAKAAKVKQSVAESWLSRQAVWQIYLPPPKKISYASFSVSVPNEVHQADLMFLPYDTVDGVTYKYVLTVVDIASRYKEAEPLSNKTATDIAKAFSEIYSRSPLTWPKLLQVDPGREFLGAVTSLMKKNNVKIRRGIVGVHHNQAIVERFNKTLAERLFGYQYAREFIQDKRSHDWVTRLPHVINALNNEVTRTISMKPATAITKLNIPLKRSSTNPPVLGSVIVRYLYKEGEAEGGRKRATDPTWSVTTHKISAVTRSSGRPAIYFLDSPAPQRGFTKEELQIIPKDTQLPPSSLM